MILHWPLNSSSIKFDSMERSGKDLERSGTGLERCGTRSGTG